MKHLKTYEDNNPYITLLKNEVDYNIYQKKPKKKIIGDIIDPTLKKNLKKKIMNINNELIFYKVGDYLLMSGRYFASGKDEKIKIIRELFYNGSGDYEILYDNGEIGVTSNKEIIRYLTNDEIKEFKLKLATKTFNL